MSQRTWSGFIAAVLCGAIGNAAVGEAAESGAFYQGKRITLVIGTGPGGDYDLHGRLLSRHFPRHIPGQPGILIQNMPGAGSVVAANHVFRLAPQDGTVIANILNTVPLGTVLGTVKPQFDPSELQWIGNMRHEVSVVVIRRAASVKTIEDARKTGIVMGATAPSALNAIHTRAMNNILGTKFRVVTGYKETAAIELAIERGEVDGSAGGTWYGEKDPYFERVQTGEIRILAQVGLHRAPDLANVPLLTDFARNDEEKQLLELFSSPAAVGKPTVVGPQVPAARVRELRAAYDATMTDREFLNDAEKLGIPISPVSGESLDTLAKDIFMTPDRLAQRARKAVGD